MKNYYELLNIQLTASQDQVFQTAMQSRNHQLVSDCIIGDWQRAYQTLANPTTKQHYDQQLNQYLLNPQGISVYGLKMPGDVTNTVTSLTPATNLVPIKTNAQPNAILVAVPAGVHYATFWERLGARFIDAIIVIITQVILMIMFIAGGSSEKEAEGAAGAVGLIVSLIYFTSWESGDRQETLGKQAFGIKVVTTKGQRITLPNALGHFFAH